MATMAFFNRLAASRRKSMKKKYLRFFAIYAIALVSVASLGCAASTWSRIIPGMGPHTDVVEGLTPPHERIEDLKEQELRAGELSPEAAESAARQLAAQCPTEEDPMIRGQMIRTLGALRAQSGRPVLEAALQDRNVDVRVAACHAWASMGDDQAVRLLSTVLANDMDTDVRFAAAKALGKTGHAGAVPALGVALDDRDPALRYVAVSSLQQCSDQDFGRDVEQWRQFAQSQTPGSTENGIAGRGDTIY